MLRIINHGFWSPFCSPQRRIQKWQMPFLSECVCCLSWDLSFLSTSSLHCLSGLTTFFSALASLLLLLFRDRRQRPSLPALYLPPLPTRLFLSTETPTLPIFLLFPSYSPPSCPSLRHLFSSSIAALCYTLLPYSSLPLFGRGTVNTSNLEHGVLTLSFKSTPVLTA